MMLIICFQIIKARRPLHSNILEVTNNNDNNDNSSKKKKKEK